MAFPAQPIPPLSPITGISYRGMENLRICLKKLKMLLKNIKFYMCSVISALLLGVGMFILFDREFHPNWEWVNPKISPRVMNTVVICHVITDICLFMYGVRRYGVPLLIRLRSFISKSKLGRFFVSFLRQTFRLTAAACLPVAAVKLGAVEDNSEAWLIFYSCLCGSILMMGIALEIYDDCGLSDTVVAVVLSLIFVSDVKKDNKYRFMFLASSIPALKYYVYPPLRAFDTWVEGAAESERLP